MSFATPTLAGRQGFMSQDMNPINQQERTTPMTTDISPIAAANALMPEWMKNIQEYDALEIHPCQTKRDSAGNEYIEQCDNPADARTSACATTAAIDP